MTERNSARPIDELDNATRNRLNDLLGCDPVSLSKGDRDFLRGRADYLTSDQKADYIKPFEKEDAQAPTASNDANDGYDEMTVPALREECESRDLPKSGNKAALIARLRDADGE